MEYGQISYSLLIVYSCSLYYFPSTNSTVLSLFAKPLQMNLSTEYDTTIIFLSNDGFMAEIWLFDLSIF